MENNPFKPPRKCLKEEDRRTAHIDPSEADTQSDSDGEELDAILGDIDARLKGIEEKLEAISRDLVRGSRVTYSRK